MFLYSGLTLYQIIRIQQSFKAESLTIQQSQLRDNKISSHVRFLLHDCGDSACVIDNGTLNITVTGKRCRYRYMSLQISVGAAYRELNLNMCSIEWQKYFKYQCMINNAYTIYIIYQAMIAESINTSISKRLIFGPYLCVLRPEG